MLFFNRSHCKSKHFRMSVLQGSFWMQHLSFYENISDFFYSLWYVLIALSFFDRYYSYPLQYSALTLQKLVQKLVICSGISHFYCSSIYFICVTPMEIFVWLYGLLNPKSCICQCTATYTCNKSVIAKSY